MRPADTNAGEINNFGGLVRFDQDLTNTSTGFVGGRGFFGADGGWTNSGVMVFSAGTADIIGDVNNTAGGQIVTTDFAVTTFFDDVVHDGTEIRTAAGSGTVFFGAVSGIGNFTGTGTVFFEGDLRPGHSPGDVSFGGDVVLGLLSVRPKSNWWAIRGAPSMTRFTSPAGCPSNRISPPTRSR